MCQQTKKYGDSRKPWIVSMLDEKEQTWGCINASSAFSLLILLPHSSFLPIITSPSTVSNFCTFYLLYLPAGPALCSSLCSAPLSTGEAASYGLQHGAACRQMSWQGEAGGLEDAHCRCHQPGI